MTSPPLKCSEVSNLLDMVVTDELAGVDVGVQHPSVMAHIQGCARCHAAYVLLRDALRQGEGPLLPFVTTSPSRLSFLEAQEESPWHRVVENASSLFPLTFEITCRFIQRALRGPRLSAVRGEPGGYAEKRTLLLADWVTTGQHGDWVVEVTACQRVDRPDVLDLEARLVSDEPLPSSLQVALSWADQHLSAPLDSEGAASFQDLPLSHLLEPESGKVKDDLVITFSTTIETG